MPIYTLNNQRYNIPDEKITAFEKAHPSASIELYANNQRYSIPLSKQQSFKNKFRKWSYSAQDAIPQPLQENIALAMAHPIAKVNPALRTQSAKPIGDVQASQNIGNKAALTFDDVQPMPEVSEVLQRNTETLAGLNAPSGLPKSPDNIQQAISQDLIGKAASQAWQRDTLNSISGMRENALKNLKARTEELRNSSEAFNDSQWLGSPSQYGYAPMTTPGVHAPNLHSDHEANMYRLTIDFLDDAEKHIETVRKNQARNGLRQAAAGVGDALFDIDTLTLGLDSLAKNFTLKAILEKADADQPLSQAEEALINAALYKQFTEAALPGSRWYNIGQGVGESIPYMLQFALSRGIAGALTKGANKAIGKTVTKYINNLALKNGGKIANKAIRALGNGISKLSAGTLKALAQTPLQPSLYNDIIERQIGTLGYSPSASNSEANTPPLPEGIGEVSRSDGGVNSRGGLQYTGRIDADNTADAIRNGLASTFITNITEGIGGEGLQFIFNKIGGGALSGLGKGYTKLTGKQIQPPRFYNRFREAVSKRGLKPMLDAIGFNGAPSEFAEEVLDGLANALIVGDQSVADVLDKDNLIDTAITTGVISLFMGGMGAALSAKVHHDVNKAFAQANHNLEKLKYSNLEIQALNDIAIDNPQNTAKWVSSITRTMRTLAIRSAEIENSLSPEARQYLAKENSTEEEFNELSPYDQQAVMALTQINNRFNELTIQRDYVVAGTNYNAMIQGLKERVAPQAEAELADIQANALRDSDYTVKVTFRGQDGYLVSGTADINDLPDGSTEATLPAGNIYQVRTKSPDGQWIIQQAVAEDITPGTVTPTQQLIDETTARIYTPVQNLINAEQAQAQAEVAQSTEQTQPTTPVDTKDPKDSIDSTVSAEQASPIFDSPASSVIGRSLSAEESQNLIAQMDQNAEVAPEVELTPENWINLFGEDGTVDTPIGSVKMGENQYLKLFKKNRAQYLGMIKPTLSNPDIVLEEYDPKDNAERESKYLFVKTFIKADGSRYVHFESVTVKKDSLEVSISSHEVNESVLTKKVQQSKLLHLNSKFLNSDGRLIEPLNEGSDLVPTPNSVSDSNKSVSTDKDTTSSLNNNILDENVLSTLKEDIENLRAKAETIEYELDYLADILNDQLGYDFRDGIDLYEKTFIKLGSNKLKTLKWFRDNVSDNKDDPNLIFDFAKTLKQIYILESQLERADEQFDEHIATLPAGDAIQAITQRRGVEEADQYATWRKGILTKERDKSQKTLNAKVKPFDASRYPDYAQMKREERKYNEALQATRSEALDIINHTTAEIADIDRYLANRNRQIAAEREAENPLRNGIAQAVEKQPINTIE
ncbi:MAG: hypothetical protein J6L03_08825, partial [Bacteroidaceae bacterium]|nr:hypothetical protein [Bacteroidaceae bacterium]